MSNKIALATIQFRADAKGANVALDSLRASAREARKTVDEMQDALDHGIKKLKDGNGVEFNVADRLKSAAKEARNFESAIHELMKGATALESVVKNIRMGEIEKSSRAELKGAINAAQSRLRPIREKGENGKLNEEDLQRQRDLNKVITESQKQLNRLDRDTEKVIETISRGGKVSEAVLKKEQEGLEKILAMIPKGTAEYKQYAAQLKEIRGYVDSIQTKELERSSKLLGSKALGRYSEDDIRKAISAGKELLATYRSGSKEAQDLTKKIAEAEAYLKTHGLEAARAAQRQAEAAKLLDDKYKMMQGRIDKLNRLSQDALTETKKFWEEQRDGATRGSRAYKEAVANLKKIADEQERLNTKQLQDSANRLNRKNLRTLSESELKQSVAAAKELLAAMKPTDKSFQQLQDSIIRAEEHMQKFGLEAERSAQKAAAQLQMMNGRMSDLGKLSDGALEETKRFWQAQMDGAERGSRAYNDAKANLEAVIAEQQRLANEQAKTGAQKLTGGNLMTMSERDIRKAIEDAKKYQQTLSASDQKYKDLSVAIADAEDHIKKYGLEAERSARKEAESLKKAEDERKKAIKLMDDQLNRYGSSLSSSALKTQEQYWQRMIDDPKNAGKSLHQYEANLQKVRQLQDQMVQAEGQKALTFFGGGIGNASANDIKRNADALKKYRDSLPQETEADTIKKINEYLVQAGVAAEKATAPTMTMKQALQTALSARSGNFKGTVEQLNLAKKTLEDLQKQAVKGGLAWRRMQEGIDSINLELQRTGHLSGEIKAILDTPKGKSFNELKLAVEQGRAALASMRIETGKDREAFDELAAKVKKADFEMKRLGATSKGTASSFEKAMGRLKTYITLYVSAATALQKVTASFADLLELSDKMGEVRKTTGFTADEVGRLSENLRKMDTRTALTGLLDLSVAAGQLGLKTQEDVEGFTEAANKLMVALPEMGKEGATEMLKVALATGEIAKIDKQMREGIIDGSSATAVAMEKVGSTIDRLRATSAATAPAITDFVKRVGAVGAQSGITIDQVAALGSTVDALGMRVEMSATALSRMIPAIKNNAFEVAKAIKVAPNDLRDLFATGRGMEAILMVFQHIKDAGLDEEGIEEMLNMGGMKDVMKQLNQQGARAGIVFAGLSQNVETLKEHLGTASRAYEGNIAIQQEYDKMNETTAARWERFKNQLEEVFVNDSMQRWLGGVIDGMRVVLDLFVRLKDGAFSVMFAFGAWKLGIGGAIWTYLIKPLNLAITGVKSLGVQITGVAAKWRAAWRAMDAASKANLMFAIASAVYLLGKAIWDAATNIDAMALSLARLDNEEAAAEREVGRLTSSLEKAIPKANEAAEKHRKLKKETDELRKEVDVLRSSTDKSTEAHDRLGKKEEELKQKEKELKSASDEMNKANKTRSGLISEINSKYSTYLGYMLNEKTAAEQVALAHLQIVDALKEELEQKRLNKEIEGIDEKHNEGIDEAGARSTASLKSLPADMQRQIRSRWNTVRGSIRYSVDENGKASYTLPAIEGLTGGEVTRGSYAELRKELEKVFGKIVREEVAGARNVRDRNGKEVPLNFGTRSVATGSTIYGTTIYSEVSNTLEDFISQSFRSFDQWTERTLKREAEIEEKRQDSESFTKGARSASIASANKMNDDAYNRVLNQIAGGAERAMENVGDLAQQVNIITANLNKFNGELDKADKYVANGNEATVENVVETLFRAFTEEQRRQIIKAAKQAQKGEAGGIGEGGSAGSSANIWGTEPEAASTDYASWNVDELVARRNQMDRFKNAIRPDTDIRKVLAEDIALMKAINDGKVQPNMNDVIDWYNAERKKIEQELKSERFSTNEGHWAAEAKTGKRKNLMPETDYALAELDRYYSRRKETLEKARIDENMSEELYNRQAELLEQKHLERRAKLRGSFTGEISKEETKAFDEWWETLHKNFELDELQREKLTTEWAKANAGQIGRNNYRMQQDMTKMQEITVKHLNKIADIVAKERPYDGIVDNLRKNLTDMDILFADMEKKGVTDAGVLVKAEAKRMRFLLGEAENAYALTVDELAKRMRENGLGEWADELMVDDQKRQSILEALHKVYDDVQNAIKKEASQIKKQVDIMWQDVMPGQSASLKDSYELAISALGLEEGRVSRANSLIGAGAASERVADKLAIQQMKLKITMQEHYYNLMEQEGRKRIAFLEREAELEKRKAERLKKEAEAAKDAGKAEEARLKARQAEEAVTKSVEASLDAQHLTTSLNISQAKELTELAKQREEIIARTEESQNRLYQSLREWADLLTGSLQDVMEASNAGNAEYYNELAKMELTGKGGPGAGTYIVIENEGTEDAAAHYEYLNDRQALERQREIEQQNAQADAWKKVMDDINAKMDEQITDWMNAALQNEAIDANTAALGLNTQALYDLLGGIAGGQSDFSDASKLKRDENGMALDGSGQVVSPIQPAVAEQPEGLPYKAPWQMTAAGIESMQNAYNAQVQASDAATAQVLNNQKKVQQGEQQTDNKIAGGAQSAFAKMTAAANLYGIAYQAMSNDNLSTAQKFEMIAVQAAGQAAISALTTSMAQNTAQVAADTPAVASKTFAQLGPIAGPAAFAAITALLGGLLGFAVSKIAKSKSQIAQVTGASVSAGRLSTGMMTYASGNVNEFTDPSTLTPGRQYNVDAADGRTYRARYMGKGAKTHVTSGPEFHLVGEAGQEAIIDAHTTRDIRLNEPEIWQSIQTLYNGGRLSAMRRRGGGVRAFADGNLDDFGDAWGTTGGIGGGTDLTAIQGSLDRNTAVQEALLARLSEPIVAQNILYGPDGLPNVIAKLQKEAARHGEKYL